MRVASVIPVDPSGTLVTGADRNAHTSPEPPPWTSQEKVRSATSSAAPSARMFTGTAVAFTQLRIPCALATLANPDTNNRAQKKDFNNARQVYHRAHRAGYPFTYYVRNGTKSRSPQPSCRFVKDPRQHVPMTHFQPPQE